MLRRRANNVAVIVRELDSKSKSGELLERGLSTKLALYTSQLESDNDGKNRKPVSTKKPFLNTHFEK